MFVRVHTYKMKIDYEKIANICLTADGGYCEKCANDVAEGFKKEYPEIDLKKLEKIIKKKLKEYYEK